MKSPGIWTSKIYSRSSSLVSQRGFNRRIAVDFDGCCVPASQNLLEIGDPLPGAMDILANLRVYGYYIVIWTSRTDCLLREEMGQEHGAIMQAMLEWLEKHDFPYDEIWLGNAKPACKYFIDDRAFTFLEDQSDACWVSIFNSIIRYRGKEWK